MLHLEDCTTVYTVPDSLVLKSVLGTIPDSLAFHDIPMKETTAFIPIPTSFNYVVISLATGFLFLIAAIVYGLFGGRIRRHYRISRLKKNHTRFLDGYSRNLEQLSHDSSTALAEATVGMWKKYLENLELTPYTKLTTRETISLLKDEAIGTSLRHIDRSIYGNQSVSVHPFEGLKDFAQTKFHKKLEEVMHE